jgi:hypothetical protein
VGTAVYGSAITALASHAIASRFVFHLLVVLEYAIVVSDAILIFMHLIINIRDSLKRIIRGAVRGILEEIKRGDAEHAAFRESFFRKLDNR